MRHSHKSIYFSNQDVFDYLEKIKEKQSISSYVENLIKADMEKQEDE